MNNKMTKKYGLLTAICMVVGIVIGSGVFFKAQTILQKTNGDVPLGIVAWILGGVIMLFCILSFSVMAQKYEKVNGIIDYAEAVVGEKYAYYVGWFVTTIYYPAMTSVLAWLSARYTLVFLCSVNPGFCEDPVAGPECLALSCLFLVGAYALNALSPVIAGQFQVSTTIIKLIPLGLMAVAGTIYGFVHTSEGASSPVLIESFSKATGDISPLFGAVVATAFAYEGWIIATSINSELKNSKKNLPIALISGGIIIIVVYILYYIGISGGSESIETLMEEGATKSFVNVFGATLGNVLNIFVAISCMGTLNGLMLGTTRGLYSVTVRGKGPAQKIFSKVDDETGMPMSSAVWGVLLCAVWLVYFYGANLVSKSWFGPFTFDSSELPIVSTYPLYIPIFVMFSVKAKDVKPVKRFVLPALAVIGSSFMVWATVYSHGILPVIASKDSGTFNCPVLFYLIIFAIIMAIGWYIEYRNNKKRG